MLQPLIYFIESMANILIIYPDYFRNFKCIKGECRHNCCIGWEIDIDEDTLTYYDSVAGDIGERIRRSISRDETPHFILGENDRCPFLNKSNLCDIIIELGEDHICGICTDHPRFKNDLPGRCEIGLGLCCEAAGRIILGKKEPSKLVGDTETDDEIIILRDKIILALQNRVKGIPERITDMLELCNTSMPSRSFDDWVTVLLDLERLDDRWTDTLNNLRLNYNSADLDGFELHMKSRQIEYEQLLVYFIYRHFANAFDLIDASSRALFAAFGYMMIHAIGAVMYTQNGRFDFEDQVELARTFSSEIEYSEENLNYLLEEFL